MCVCVCIAVDVCMCTYMYSYMYVYTHIHTHRANVFLCFFAKKNLYSFQSVKLNKLLTFKESHGVKRVSHKSTLTKDMT